MNPFRRRPKPDASRDAPDRGPSESISLELEWVAATNGHKPLVDDHVFLLGRPPLRQYLSFVTDLAIAGAVPSEGALADEWRTASDVIARREIDEAGIADDPVFQPVPEHLIPLKERFESNEIYRRGFDMVPTEILMVELDRMVVYQKHINLEFTQQLRARLGVKPSDEEVFNTCLPLEGQQQPPLKWMRTGGGTYVFVSPSNDIRYLGSMQLKPENIVNYPVPGNTAMAIGLAVGFGSNFLNAIHCENRLVLNNGSHRAFAMRELGFTHVPCIVQHVGSREELKAVASSDLRRHPDLYLRGPRPSMMKDYFDPELRKVVPCQRRLRQVKLRYFSDESDLPAV